VSASAGTGDRCATSAPRQVAITHCMLCASDAARALISDPPYTVLRCTACGMVWTTPRLSDLRAVYDDGYWRSATPRQRGYGDYRADEPLYLKTFRRRLAIVRRHTARPGTLLDVGCAAGYFLAVMREAGWEVAGVDLSSEIVAHAHARFGFTALHAGTLETAPWPPASFDLVTLWDLVEHVPDPRAVLMQAHRLLRPDGVLVLETQDVASPFARLLGARWHHFKHAEHLYHFDAATIRRLLAQAGFAVVELTRRSAGKYVSVDFIAERAARLHPVFSVMLRPLTRLRGANVYLNFGDEMIVVARPNDCGHTSAEA